MTTIPRNPMMARPLRLQIQPAGVYRMDEALDEQAVRSELCQAALQLWSRGLIVGDGGQLSVQIHRRRFLVTPAGRRRCDLAPRDLMVVDIGGLGIGGEGDLPDDAWRPHRLAYQAQRSGSAAAEPVAATVLATPAHVLALLRHRRDADSLTLGDGPARLELPVVGPEEDAALRQHLEHGHAALIRGVGLLCVGPNLATALNRIEQLEHAATIELACPPNA